MPESEFTLDEPRPDPASLISGVFQFGHDYEMFHDIDILGGYVQDRASRAVVAVVPDFPDDEFVTRAGRWRIAVERRGRARGWAIVARTSARPDSVAAA